MRAIVCGANGAMGQLVQKSLNGQAAGLVSIDGQNNVPKSFRELGDVQADVIIDFSHHTAIGSVMEYAKAHKIAVVVGTTGHTEEEKTIIAEASKEIPVFFSGNMSLGIAVLCRLAKQAAAAFPDADLEIVEVHHNRKVDAPSGTANMLFEALREVRPQAKAHCGRAGEGRREKEEIGIQSLRMGNIVGIHEVHVCTGSQTLTLRHEAHDRGMFADGAVEAATFLVNKPAGLYNMTGLLEA